MRSKLQKELDESSKRLAFYHRKAAEEARNMQRLLKEMRRKELA